MHPEQSRRTPTLAPFFRSSPRAPRYPVVLMHGMGVLAHTLKPGSVFTTTVRALRRRGLPAYAPTVPAYSPVAVRARVWQHHCYRLLEHTGADRLNLIAFSSAGLDARYLVETLQGGAFVASLVTVATPHRGSSIASLVLRLPFRPLIFRLIEAMARAFYPAAPPDVLATLRELTPQVRARPAAELAVDLDRVPCYSLSAEAGRGSAAPVSPLMWVPNRWLYRQEGLNDGFVGAASAVWATHLGPVLADHAQLVGIADAGFPFDAVRFYSALISWLAAQGY